MKQDQEKQVGVKEAQVTLVPVAPLVDSAVDLPPPKKGRSCSNGKPIILVATTPWGGEQIPKNPTAIYQRWYSKKVWTSFDSLFDSLQSSVQGHE